MEKIYLYLYYKSGKKVVFEGKYATQDPVLDYIFSIPSLRNKAKFHRDGLFR